MTRGKYLYAGPQLVILLVFLSSPRNCPAQPDFPQNGKIRGESFVNLRSGPGLDHPPVTVLRQTDKLRVEGQERSWYRVSRSDGVKGYVHKDFVEILGKAKATRPPVETKPAAAPIQPQAPGKLPPLPPDIPAPEENEPKRKTPAAYPLIGPKYRELLILLTAFLCFFILGWILGGNHYLRRERARRDRLHF